MLKRTAFACCALSLLVGACIDPDAKFDDFVTRIPDAAPQPDAAILSEIPDITGRFFITLPTVVDVDLPFFFIADNTMTANPDGTATLDTTIQSLDYTTLLPVGDAVTFTAVPISMTGQFELTTTDLTIVGPANPITGAPLLASTITLMPTIKSVDLFCGPVTGMVVDPLSIDLTGSNMGAIRVPAGTVGMDLPEPVGECPPDMIMPDAGVPDAMPADAAVPDAQVPDAGVTDAGVSDANVFDAQVIDSAP